MPHQTAEEEYDALIALEEAYNAITSQKYSDLITMATVSGAISTDINGEEMICHLYIPNSHFIFL